MNWLVRLGQRLPRSWRFALARSPIAPLLRCYFNRFYWREGRIVVVELAAPLEGHQMKLDWQTDKAFVFWDLRTGCRHCHPTTFAARHDRR
jgi:hypothetical protein